jgi:hypothetical protein
MTKYLLLYRAPVSAAEQMASSTPEAAQAGMAWGERAGSAVVDMGSPVQSISGSAGGDQIGGYAIMRADSLEALQKVLEGHPIPSGAAQLRSSSSSRCPAPEASSVAVSADDQPASMEECSVHC